MTLPSEEPLPPETRNEALADFSARCDAIEEAYEFMLAYAAQGLTTEEGSTSGSQIRGYLLKCEAALAGLCNAVTSAVRQLGIRSTAPYDAFVGVVERDVRSAQAAVALSARAAVNRVAAGRQPERLDSPAGRTDGPFPSRRSAEEVASRPRSSLINFSGAARIAERGARISGICKRRATPRGGCHVWKMTTNFWDATLKCLCQIDEFPWEFAVIAFEALCLLL